MEPRNIKSNHHGGRNVNIVTVLCALAGQEGCDGEPYDEMMLAAEYITNLEQMVKELEERLSSEHILDLELKNEKLESRLAPYIKMEENLLRRIRELDTRDELEKKQEKYPAGHALAKNLGLVHQVKREKKEDVEEDQYYFEPVLPLSKGGCYRCGETRLDMCMATKTDRCIHCGQKYYKI